MTTISEVLRTGAERWGTKTAVDICGDRLSYSELLVESTCRANGLAELGLQPGDRICTMLDNNIDAVLTILGASLLGVVTVPLNTASKGEFLRHQIADSDAKAIVAEGDYVSRLADIKDGLPLLSTIVYRGATDLRLPNVRFLPLGEVLIGRSERLNAAIAPNDIAMLLYTSGTTGPSKGCIIGHNYICNMGRVSAVHTGISASDVYWTPCPLYHIGALGGTLLGGLQLGATLAIAERFSLSNF